MDIIHQAQEKRERLRAELARIEAFLGTAYELQQEFGNAGTLSIKPRTDSEKADAPVRARATGRVGSGAETVRTVIEILSERGHAMSTRELLPLVRAKGIEVGGKDALATLSARISKKEGLYLTNGKWNVSGSQEGSEQSGSDEEAAGLPAKEGPADFHSETEEEANAAALVN